VNIIVLKERRKHRKASEKLKVLETKLESEQEKYVIFNIL
jgi:hypothetical protein